MDPTSYRCRLCLDPSAECFTTIDNPQLKEQMEKVFCFSIEPKQGFCSSVCHSCAYAISEFYQYSEKVRLNQATLDENGTYCDPTVDSKITIESVKVNTLSDSVFLETTAKTCDAKNAGSEEVKVSAIDPNIALERVKVEMHSVSELPETTEPNDELTEDDDKDEMHKPPPQIKRKGRPRKIKLVDVEADEATNTKIQKRNEEDQLFKKHFRMICELCGTSSATFTALHSHFRKKHERSGWIVCCNTKLRLRSAMLDHINFHANPDAFRCEVCGVKHTYKAALDKHKLRKHSSEDQRPFKCDVCPQSFALKSTFNNHTMKHLKVQCPKCKKVCVKRSYNYHMISKHGDMDRSVVCTICEKLFVNKQRLDHHMKQHMAIEVQRVQCEICQRWLKNKGTLHNHMNTVHADNDLEFQCDICSKMFRHIRALQNHKIAVHVEAKHECEFCGKKFKRAAGLRIDPKQGYYSSVCQSCSYAISEFYQYSEKVRQNQEALDGNVTHCDPTVDLKIKISDSWLTGMTENSYEPENKVSEHVLTNDLKITLERVKVEPYNDSELPEKTEPNDEVSEHENDPCSGEDELFQPPFRQGRPEKNKLDDVEGHEPSKNSNQSITEIQQKRNEENQLVNKHFRMICDICGASVATFRALQSHYRKKHNRAGWIVCCNTKLFKRKTMLDHINFHANPDAFRCERYVICVRRLKQFTTKLALSRHNLRQHSCEDQRPFKCEVCPQSFAAKRDFLTHTRGHIKVECHVKCPKCNKIFSNKSSYDIHMRNQHSDIDRTIVCTICEKLFVTKKGFNRHMKEHMGIVEQRVQCGVCQLWLKHKDILRRHMKTVHADGGQKFKCDICLKQYRYSRALQAHISVVHAEPKHECEFCGKKYRILAHLREHHATHSWETLLACEYCGKRLKYKKSLSRHIKQQHPAEWAQKRKTMRNSERL